MDTQGFPPRLDLFKSMADHLAQKHADEDDDPSIAELGKNWLRGFLNRHPELSTRYSTNFVKQRALASDPEVIASYFQKLEIILRKYKFKPHNMYNMDEKGFLLCISDRGKVIVRRGQRNAEEMTDGSRDWVTAVKPVERLRCYPRCLSTKARAFREIG